jgi:hypothetical protein
LRTFLGGVAVGGVALITVDAAEVAHGEMAGAIRSAGYPCAHVLKLDSAGADTWIVECNSGPFRVSREKDGSFTVVPAAGQAKR